MADTGVAPRRAGFHPTKGAQDAQGAQGAAQGGVGREAEPGLADPGARRQPAAPRFAPWPARARGPACGAALRALPT